MIATRDIGEAAAEELLKLDFRQQHTRELLGQRDFDQRFPLYGYTVQATQPLFRMQNWITFEQSKTQVGQGEYVLASAQQDLVVRVVQAYLDVLLAQFTIELTESQKAAFSQAFSNAT